MVTATMKDDDNTWCLQTAELLSAHVYFQYEASSTTLIISKATVSVMFTEYLHSQLFKQSLIHRRKYGMPSTEMTGQKPHVTVQTDQRLEQKKCF